MYPIYKQFATSFIRRTIAQWLGHRICNLRIAGSNLIEGEKYVFLFILLNKMHITFYQKQSHGEHDILALLHFSCAISCNIMAFKYNFIALVINLRDNSSDQRERERERERERDRHKIHTQIDQNKSNY